jgi:hypothetical protein
LATLINNIVCYYSLKGSILPRGGNLDNASSYLKTSGGNKKAIFDVWRGVFLVLFWTDIRQNASFLGMTKGKWWRI